MELPYLTTATIPRRLQKLPHDPDLSMRNDLTVVVSTNVACDFSKGKRGAVLMRPTRTRGTLHLDDDLLEAFRARADRRGNRCQTPINEPLRAHLIANPAFDSALLRKILRQALNRVEIA